MKSPMTIDHSSLVSTRESYLCAILLRAIAVELMPDFALCKRFRPLFIDSMNIMIHISTVFWIPSCTHIRVMIQVSNIPMIPVVVVKKAIASIADLFISGRIGENNKKIKFAIGGISSAKTYTRIVRKISIRSCVLYFHATRPACSTSPEYS